MDLIARRAGNSDLTEQECALLHALISRQGDEVSKEDLYREVWGYRSMPQGRALDYAIRRLRQKVEDGSSKPLYLTSRRGGGFRLEWTPISEATEQQKFGVPASTAKWYGERSRVNLLKQRLKEGPRIVSILGPAGVGKTRLLIEALQDYDQPVFWFSLHEDRDVWSILADLCDAYKATEVPLLGDLDALFEELALAIGTSSEVPLLVLDGAEEQAKELTTRLADLIKGNQLRVFVTSRARLGIAGEELMDVSPMTPSAGLGFVRSRLASQASLDEEDLLELVRLLDGLPLALELVSPLLRMVTPSQLLKRLRFRRSGRRVRQMATPSQLLERSRTSGSSSSFIGEFQPLTQLVEGTMGDLSETQQRLLRVLALLPRGATLETVEAFLSFLDAGLGTLRGLVDRSLVISFDDQLGGRRLRVLWAVRSLIAETEPDETDWGQEQARDLLARHAAQFEATESCLALYQESNVRLREMMRAELGQAHVWIEALIHGKYHEEAARLSLAFSQLTHWNGSSRQAVLILVSTAKRLEAAEHQQWLWAKAATVAFEVQEWEDGELFLGESRDLGGISSETQARQALAELVVCRQKGDFDAIQQWAEQLWSHQSEHELAAIVCRGMLVYSSSLSFQNVAERAAEVREEAIALATTRGVGHAWVSIHNLQAFHHFLAGDFNAAAFSYRRAARVATRFGDQKSIAALHSKLSLCLLNSGDLGGARRARMEAIARIDPKLDSDSYARLLSYEAEYQLKQDPEKALQTARDAVELARTNASMQSFLTCQHRALTIGLQVEGDYPFMPYLQEFEQRAQVHEGGYFHAFSLLIRGTIAVREDRLEWARECLDQAWSITQQRIGLPEGVNLLGSLAELAIDMNKPELCRYFLDQAVEHYAHGDWPRVLTEREVFLRVKEKLNASQEPS